MDGDSVYPVHRPYTILPNVPDAYFDFHVSGGNIGDKQALVFSPYTRKVSVVQKPKQSTFARGFCNSHLQSGCHHNTVISMDFW